MTNERFKEIYERSSHTPTVLLYEYFREEKPATKIDLQEFQSALQMWIMMRTFGRGSVDMIVEYLKEKYK